MCILCPVYIQHMSVCVVSGKNRGKFSIVTDFSSLSRSIVPQYRLLYDSRNSSIRVFPFSCSIIILVRSAIYFSILCVKKWSWYVFFVVKRMISIANVLLVIKSHETEDNCRKTFLSITKARISRKKIGRQFS